MKEKGRKEKGVIEIGMEKEKKEVKGKIEFEKIEIRRMFYDLIKMKEREERQKRERKNKNRDIVDKSLIEREEVDIRMQEKREKEGKVKMKGVEEEVKIRGGREILEIGDEKELKGIMKENVKIVRELKRESGELRLNERDIKSQKFFEDMGLEKKLIRGKGNV